MSGMELTQGSAVKRALAALKAGIKTYTSLVVDLATAYKADNAETLKPLNVGDTGRAVYSAVKAECEKLGCWSDATVKALHRKGVKWGRKVGGGASGGGTPSVAKLLAKAAADENLTEAALDALDWAAFDAAKAQAETVVAAFVGYEATHERDEG